MDIIITNCSGFKVNKDISLTYIIANKPEKVILIPLPSDPHLLIPSSKSGPSDSEQNI